MKMSDLSDSCLYVVLPKHPSNTDDLQKVNVAMSEKPDKDVILDFTMVEVMTSATISNLLILRQILMDAQKRLILCNVKFLNKCVFTVCGLQDKFEFSPDKNTALEALKIIPVNQE